MTTVAGNARQDEKSYRGCWRWFGRGGDQCLSIISWGDS